MYKISDILPSYVTLVKFMFSKSILLLVFVLASPFAGAESGTYVTLAQVKEQNIAEEANIIARVRHLPSVDFVITVGGIVDFVTSKSGQKITKGEKIITINSDVTDSGVHAAHEAFKDAEADYKRNQELHSRKIISKASLEDSKLKLLQAKNALANAQKEVRDTIITAPFDGVLGNITFRSGDRVSAGEYIVSLVGVESTELYALLPQHFAGKAVTGSVITPDGRIIKADLVASSEYADQKTGNISMTFTVQEKNSLVHGTYAQMIVRTNEHKALVVPEKAVMLDSDGAHIFIFDENTSKAVRKNVKLGVRCSPVIEVVADHIADGNRIVLEGAHKVHDGVLLAPIEG